MKKAWGILFVLTLCALILCISASAETSGTCGENLTWVLDDEGTLTISGTGEMNSHPWTAGDVKKVVIEDGVTSIDNDAFSGCISLTSVTIPEGVTSIIGEAFSGCSSLTEITLPKTLESISETAFDDTGLEKVYVKCGSWADTWATDKGYTVVRSDHTEAVDAAVPPTCAQMGLTEGKHCSVCNEVLVAQKTVDALDHDLVHHNARAVTCTEIGWNAYDTCNNCDYTTYMEISAPGHNLTLHDRAEATYTAAGTEAYWECTACHKLFGNEAGTTEIEAPEVIPVRIPTEEEQAKIDDAIAKINNLPATAGIGDKAAVEATGARVIFLL